MGIALPSAATHITGPPARTASPDLYAPAAPAAVKQISAVLLAAPVPLRCVFLPRAALAKMATTKGGLSPRAPWCRHHGQAFGN
jgi:hypothetical protein